MLNVVLETKACTMFMNGMIIESYCHKSPDEVHETLQKTVLIVPGRLTSFGANKSEVLHDTIPHSNCMFDQLFLRVCN